MTTNLPFDEWRKKTGTAACADGDTATRGVEFPPCAGQTCRIGIQTREKIRPVCPGRMMAKDHKRWRAPRCLRRESGHRGAARCVEERSRPGKSCRARAMGGMEKYR